MGQVNLALKTMLAIHHAMVADQGASFRQWEGKIFPHLDDAYRGTDDGFRGHLGASQLGDECGRALWYTFRWATKNQHSGQVLRLFNRGHLEEGRFIAMLLMVGVQVAQQDEKGKQFRINFASGHGGGSGDGFGLGIPDLDPNTWSGLEFKTHNDKSFKELAGENFREWFRYQTGESKKPVPFTGKGVRDAKTEHYVQMQTYMRKFGVPCCLYGAVNKNTDDVYLEIVLLDSAFADQVLDRGERVIWLHDAPKRINESVGYFGCKWCDHQPVCKLGSPPHRNCRTCAYSEPRATDAQDAQWFCKMHERPIPRDAQVVGCDQYSVKKM